MCRGVNPFSARAFASAFLSRSSFATCKKRYKRAIMIDVIKVFLFWDCTLVFSVFLIGTKSKEENAKQNGEE